jgi:hypothetical protein
LPGRGWLNLAGCRTRYAGSAHDRFDKLSICHGVVEFELAGMAVAFRIGHSAPHPPPPSLDYRSIKDATMRGQTYCPSWCRCVEWYPIGIPPTPKQFSLSYNPLIYWSERRDSNPRPPVPQTDALPDCATLRPWGSHFGRYTPGHSGLQPLVASL